MKHSDNSDSEFVARALGGDVHPDVERAYHRVLARAAEPPPQTRWYPQFAAIALACGFVLGLIFTPLGGYARSFLTIFEPEQFAPIEISRADLRELHLMPQADDVGTQRIVRKPQRVSYGSIASAQAHVDFRVMRPTALPAKFGTVHSFSVLSPGEMTFTFSAAKARAFEKRVHKALPPMPAQLDGTTVRFQAGQVFRAHYEAKNKFFELVESPAPRVTSTGAPLATLERYLLAMPNVSPDLANQIRALGDIQNIVPVPVVIDKQTAQRVTVDGAQGLAIGDNTGLGAGVMWQKNGVIYVVAGPLTMNEVMTVANGLR